MLGEKVAKRQTESQQHPRKFTKAAAWECREPCPLSQEGLVPAGQSERVRSPTPTVDLPSGLTPPVLQRNGGKGQGQEKSTC